MDWVIQWVYTIATIRCFDMLEPQEMCKHSWLLDSISISSTQDNLILHWNHDMYGTIIYEGRKTHDQHVSHNAQGSFGYKDITRSLKKFKNGKAADTIHPCPKMKK